MTTISATRETHEDSRARGFARAAIIAAYVVLFWLLLPYTLYMLGVRFDRWLVLPAPAWPARGLGSVLGIVGAVQVARAMHALVRIGRGLPISHLPPLQLVSAGPYARLRHPLYVAFTASWIGVALAIGSWGAALGSGALLTLGWIAYVKVLEEPRLLARFGAGYGAYLARTQLLPVVAPSALRARLVALWFRALPTFEALANRTTLYRGHRISFVTYGAFVGVAAFTMALWSCADLHAVGLAPDRLWQLAISVAIAMLCGGRLVGLLYRAEVSRCGWREALRTIALVSFGGYAGLALAVLACAAVFGMPVGSLLDRLVLPGLLAAAIGRLGCLSYGCCGGKPWPHGIAWRDPHARIVRELGATAQVARIPTQLLSSAHALSLLVVLLAIGTRPLPAGALSALCALLYGLGRSAIEHTREEARFFGLQVTRGQIASLGLAGIGLSALLTLDAHGVSTPVVRAIPLSAFGVALPIALACGVTTMLATGLHGPRVGRW